MTTHTVSLAEAMATPIKKWWDAFFDLVQFADDAATGEIALQEGGTLSAFTSARLHRQRVKRENLRKEVRRAFDGWIGDTSVGALKVGGVKACIVNGGAAPNTCCPVEIDVVPTCIATALLNGEVSVQAKSLQFGKQGIIFVEVPPTRLYYAHIFRKIWNGAQ
jgi:hypothetical protein